MDESLVGLASLLGTIRNLYPQARVTSGYRGPDNPLTRRNPASFHALGSPSDPRAVDVAPIPGVTFGDYVSSVKKAGVPVAQAFDEASHPFPWTTGPNWHLATGNPQVAAPRKSFDPNKPPRISTLGDLVSIDAQPMAQAPMTLADLQAPQVQPKSNKTVHTLGNIAGILGDALMAYGGMQPQFAPTLTREREQEADRSFDREKLNATLELAREKALAPHPLTQTQQFVNEVMDPNTPPARKALLRAILTRPLIGTITNSDGSQYQTTTYPGDSSDDADWENY